MEVTGDKRGGQKQVPVPKEPVLSFYHADSGQTQVVRLGGKGLHLLIHSAGPLSDI